MGTGREGGYIYGIGVANRIEIRQGRNGTYMARSKNKITPPTRKKTPVLFRFARGQFSSVQFSFSSLEVLLVPRRGVTVGDGSWKYVGARGTVLEVRMQTA